MGLFDFLFGNSDSEEEKEENNNYSRLFSLASRLG